MLGKKILLDQSTVQLLKTMKSRTGLTHQYTCRLAFCLSLAEPGAPDPSEYNEQGVEFNRYTLTGEWDRLFVAYLQQWLIDEEPKRDYTPAQWFRAHINRGLTIIPRRVRRLDDVAKLVPA